MATALAGLKVLELGDSVAAAYATKLMADMGAEVIKLENPKGDRTRRRGPFPGHTPHPEKSGLFLYLNTNKLGATLDIAQPEGFALLEKLFAEVDVMVHDFAPPEMDRIGLNYDRLRQINPRVVMTSITPFGLTGPWRDRRAEELTTWSAGGLIVLNGGGPAHPEMPPLKTFGNQSRFQGGVHAATATMAAVLAQARDGEGQHIDVSIQEVLASQLELTFEYWPYMKMIATRLGRKPIQPMEALECKDGWIYACCVEEHQWRGFVEAMGNPEWANEEIFGDRFKRADNWEALELFLKDYLSEHTVLEVYKAVQQRRVPFAPVSTMGDLINSEHLKARGFFVEIAQSQAGTHKYPGAPLKYGATPWTIRMPAPVLGQHNEEIYGRRLGLPPKRIAELKRAGVI
jgi:crotonobetainyl-CoA:carnitine CoA-transferase CaiB-like acyl-CoA transferase